MIDIMSDTTVTAYLKLKISQFQFNAVFWYFLWFVFLLFAIL